MLIRLMVLSGIDYSKKVNQEDLDYYQQRINGVLSRIQLHNLAKLVHT